MSRRSQWIVSKTEAVSNEAMVATMHPLATEAGIAMLKQGGNAVDAAVAAAFAVGVVEPFNSGLGGIAQLVFYESRTGRSYVVDGIPTLPLGIRPEMFELLEPGGRAGVYGWPAVKDDANNTGYRAATVPGTPACLCEALARFGRLSLRLILAPAIALAEQGYELDWYVALALAAGQGRLQHFPASRRTFFKPDGSCYRAPMLAMEAERLLQRDLARSLHLLAQQGPDALYRGEVGQRIAEDLAANGGLITAAELASYHARIWEPGLLGDYRGYRTIQAPQHTGGPTVLEALNILEGFDLRSMGHNSVFVLHLVAEALRRAFLDRFRYLGDASHCPVPHVGLVSKSYAAQRRQEISLKCARPEATPGNPWPFEARVPSGPPREASPTRASSAGTGETTQITVVDADRNMVSLTSTLGGHFGSGVVVPGTGIVLNNATMWFDPVPGSVNSIGPEKRILWAGTPTLVLRDDKPFFAVGAPGGRKIISAVLQAILTVVDFGLGAQDAVTARRIHCEGRETLIDAHVGQGIVDALRQLGHVVVVQEESFSSSYFARPNSILIEPDTGKLRGGVNQYKPAMAMGL